MTPTNPVPAKPGPAQSYQAWARGLADDERPEVRAAAKAMLLADDLLAARSQLPKYEVDRRRGSRPLPTEPAPLTADRPRRPCAAAATPLREPRQPVLTAS